MSEIRQRPAGATKGDVRTLTGEQLAARLERAGLGRVPRAAEAPGQERQRPRPSAVPEPAEMEPEED